jgi:photosystem II stability/assembly factor-like uncharacterized protein
MRIDAGPAAGLSRWAIVAGRLLRTDDNWVTFRVVGVSGVSGVAAAACPAADTCWVLGSPAIVARTTDGGRNWTRLPVPGASVLVGIDATDAAHARVRTADGRTLQTDDSGATWK